MLSDLSESINKQSSALAESRSKTLHSDLNQYRQSGSRENAFSPRNNNIDIAVTSEVWRCQTSATTPKTSRKDLLYLQLPGNADWTGYRVP